MTSILGIQTDAEDDEVVMLAADTQVTLYSGPNYNEEKDPYPQSKVREVNESTVIAMCGTYDRYVENLFTYLRDKDYRKFLSTLHDGKTIPELDNISNQLRYLKRDVRRRLRELLEGRSQPTSELEEIVVQLTKGQPEIKSALDLFITGLIQNILTPPDPIQEALRSSVFYEAADLNRHFTRRNREKEEEIELDDYTELAIATNSPLALYTVDLFGGIKKLQIGSGDIDYISIGSGSEFLDQYIRQGTYKDDPELKEYFPEFHANFRIESISSRCAYELTYGAMMYATKRDQYSGGVIEIVTHRPNIIIPHKVTIKKAIREAEKAAVRSEAAKLSY